MKMSIKEEKGGKHDDDDDDETMMRGSGSWSSLWYCFRNRRHCCRDTYTTQSCNLWNVRAGSRKKVSPRRRNISKSRDIGTQARNAIRSGRDKGTAGWSSCDSPSEVRQISPHTYALPRYSWVFQVLPTYIIPNHWRITATVLYSLWSHYGVCLAHQHLLLLLGNIPTFVRWSPMLVDQLPFFGWASYFWCTTPFWFIFPFYHCHQMGYTVYSLFLKHPCGHVDFVIHDFPKNCHVSHFIPWYIPLDPYITRGSYALYLNDVLINLLPPGLWCDRGRELRALRLGLRHLPRSRQLLGMLPGGRASWASEEVVGRSFCLRRLAQNFPCEMSVCISTAQACAKCG